MKLMRLHARLASLPVWARIAVLSAAAPFVGRLYWELWRLAFRGADVPVDFLMPRG